MPEKSRTVIKIMLFALILVLCIYLGRVIHFDIETLRQTINKYPVGLSGLIYIVIYVLTTTFIWFGPKDVLRIAAAVIFGAAKSTIFVGIAEVFNTIILFHISRGLGRDFVQKKFKIKKGDMDHAQNNSDIFAVAVLTLNPLLPLRLLNLGYGLTQIDFKKYFLTVICMLPFRTYWLQSVLAVVGEGIFTNPLTLAHQLAQDPQRFLYNFVYVLVVFVLTIVLIIKKTMTKRFVST